MKKTLIILAVVVAVIGLYAWGIYNKMVTGNENVDNQWAQVETQYQRRFDLIPNLVNSVQGAMAQEQKVFGDLAEARTRYAGAQTVNEKAEAATQVEGALARPFWLILPKCQSLSNRLFSTSVAVRRNSEPGTYFY